MRMRIFITTIACSSLLFAWGGMQAHAQTIVQWTMGSGGASSGNSFSMQGSVAQGVSHAMSDGVYELLGGYWPRVATASPTVTPTTPVPASTTPAPASTTPVPLTVTPTTPTPTVPVGESKRQYLPIAIH